MTWIGKNAHSPSARGAWILGAAAAVLMFVGVGDLPAQSVDVEQLFAQLLNSFSHSPRARCPRKLTTSSAPGTGTESHIQEATAVSSLTRTAFPEITAQLLSMKCP